MTEVNGVTGGTVRRVGLTKMLRVDSSYELRWSTPTGRGESETRSVSRGGPRLEITIPVHARAKVIVASLIMAVVTGGVMIGLLHLATKDDSLPAGAPASAIAAGVLVGTLIGYALGRVREHLVIDSRLLTVSDAPYDFACMRKDVGRFVEYAPGSMPRVFSGWGRPRLGIVAAGRDDTVALPLGGSALSDPELAAVLSAANEFAELTPPDPAFDASELDGYPALVTLTDPH